MYFRRRYYDAEPIYLREQTPQWYQQLQTTNERIQGILLELIQPNSHVLQVGCGGAWLGRFLVQKGIASYTGFDFSESAIKYAKLRVGKFKNAKVYKGDALDFESYPRDMDLILSHQFAQCMIGDDRKTWLENARMALKPETGRLLISSLVGIPEGLTSTVDPQTRVNKTRNRYFADIEELRTEITQTGYKIENEWLPEENVAILLVRPIDS